MGPIANEVASSFTDQSVKFVTFDFTTEETKHKAAAEAKALGVAGIHAENVPNTGFALVYNTKTQKVITKLSAAQDAAQWTTELKKGLGGA